MAWRIFEGGTASTLPMLLCENDYDITCITHAHARTCYFMVPVPAILAIATCAVPCFCQYKQTLHRVSPLNGQNKLARARVCNLA